MVERTSFFYICISVLSFTGCVPDGGGDSDEDATVMRRDASADEQAPDVAFPDVGRVAPPVAADCAPSGDERCNDADDDCDGEVDEGFDTGGACTVGRGACEATGTWICAEGGGTTCSATAGEPVDERCNTRDDDCDGATDEGYPVGVACSIREAACVSRGTTVCSEDGAETVCGAAPIVVGEERCNQRDDDCDGAADEGIVLGESCVAGVGLCRRGGVTACGGDEEVVCDAQPGPALAEECNGFDDDCDGTPDEDFGGEPCEAGVGACLRRGFRVCSGEGELTCNVEPGPPGGEVCNGVDDDCDGTVDEGYAERLGQPCSVGVGACTRESVWACDPEGGGGIAFEGIRQDVPLAELEDGGFVECWSGLFGGNEPLGPILDACSDGILLLGCMPNGADALTLAAMGERDEVLTDVGGGADAVHPHNGVDWYYNGQSSWGFAPPGAGVSRNSCDTDDAQGDLRMCWHTGGNNVSSGYRCGDTFLNGNNGWTRVIYHRPAGPGLVCDAVAAEPAAVDACNGADDDCDGSIDEDTPGLGEPCEGIELGLCQAARIGCTPGGAIECVAVDVPPEREFCNGVDDDCDGSTDEDYPTVGEPCAVGTGICAAEGVVQCSDDGGGGGLEFEGIRQNVPEAELLAGGFEQCFRGTYNGNEPIGPILERCNEGVLLLGCRPAGAAALTLAAMGERAEVLTDTGDGQDAVHNHNGVDWYFSDAWSWGFAPEGVGVNRFSCDTNNVQPELRMCWHTGGGNLNNGFRCGNTFDDRYERVIYHRPDGPGAVCSVPAGEPLEAELCNGLDDDCDGATDEDVPGVGEDCYDGIGACERGVGACEPDVGFVCRGVPIEVPSDEVCNGFDDDCNGEIDDLPGRGEPCEVGVGACARPAVLDCPPGGGLQLVEGIQRDVPLGEVERMGFRECFRGVYSGNEPIGPILEECAGDVMMIGCREVGQADLHVAAMGLREDVLFDTGQDAGGVHEANGVGWYYSDQYSWGFAPAGAPVNRNSCDVEGPADETRMCWHTGGGNLNFGWRCGSNTGAGANTERFVFVADRVGGALECVGEPGEPLDAEACNGDDDDCDGLTDEGIEGVGDDCFDGIGACQRGVGVCEPDVGLMCLPVPIEEPTEELCNGFDDDCSGEIDDLPGRGDPCEVGVGACARVGVLDCPADGGVGLVEGIMRDVELAEVERMGLRECFRGRYSGNEPIAPILDACAGELMMIGCREVGQANLHVAAMGLREDVLFDTGQVANGVHEANGVGWYYSDQYSWGFAPAGAPVNRNSCDVEGQADETRMCWHTGGGNLNFGWRCGSNTGAGANTERFVFAADRLGSRLACTAEPGDAAAEICNGVDDDCDGAADEGLACP